MLNSKENLHKHLEPKSGKELPNLKRSVIVTRITPLKTKRLRVEKSSVKGKTSKVEGCESLVYLNHHKLVNIQIKIPDINEPDIKYFKPASVENAESHLKTLEI